MTRRLFLSIFLLAIIITAHVLRYDVEATKAVNNTQYYKWIRDKWTGELWTQRYSPQGLIETPQSEVRTWAIKRQNAYTYVGYGALAASGLWAAWETSKVFKKK